MVRRAAIAAAVVIAAAGVQAQDNRVDVVTPMAPELAAYGTLDVGVRTIQVTDRNRPDILNTKPGGATARYDRTLTLEVWYPAQLAPGQKPGGDYRVITRDPAVMATLHGKAVRDAVPLTAATAYPLVIISHGYPGNRFLMSHLAENLASKGYVTVSIDHKDSTYDDQKAFASTLYNRPFDQLFVLNEVTRLSRNGSGSFLSGLVDTNRTGIVGYSMGGYGVVNVIGGGYSKAVEAQNGAPPNRLLADRGAANPDYQKSIDPRIKAAIAIAPWGMAGGFWDADGLKGVRTPSCSSPAASTMSRIRERDQGDLSRRGERGSLPADIHQRESQCGGADSSTRRNLRLLRDTEIVSVHALRRRGVGHGAHEQHRGPLCDRIS